jgi:hypothetical protein
MVTRMGRGKPVISGVVAAVPYALAGFAAAFGGSAFGSELEFHPVESAAIEVNGEPRSDARLFYSSKESDLYIVDLPSESKEVLVTGSKAILLMRSEVHQRTDKKNGEVLSIDPRARLGASSYVLIRDADMMGFKTDISDVMVRLPASEPGPPSAAPPGGAKAAPPSGKAGAAPPAGDDPPSSAASTPASQASAENTPLAWAGTLPTHAAWDEEARACVRLETRPTPGIPSCSKSIYLRNTCDAPVDVTMRRTEHLMTGTLTEMASAPVPANTEEWIGCSWWGGATAPAEHDILGACFLEPHHGHRHGERH